MIQNINKSLSDIKLNQFEKVNINIYRQFKKLELKKEKYFITFIK